MPLFMRYVVRVAGGAFIALLLIDSFVGCKIPEETADLRDHKFRKATYEGHSYVFYDGFHESSMVHDPDCPCQKK